MSTTAVDPAPVAAPRLVRDVPRLVLTAGRILLRHWPALLALALLGAGLRAGATWLAVIVSGHNHFLGQLLVVLAPLGYLLPIVAMLHVCRESLPNLRRLEETTAPEAVTEGRPRRLVDVAVSVLVPFLAVYVSYGLLDQDLDRFRNEAAFAEFQSLDFSKDQHFDFAGRVGIYSWQIALMIVVVAWVLRFALGRIENITRFLALAFVGALIEVYYTSQVAGQTLVLKTEGMQWIDQRRVVRAVTTAYDHVVDWLGPVGNVVDPVVHWLGNLLGSLDSVVVVPAAWLAVAAVVLGHKLTPPAPVTHPVVDRFNRIPAGLRKQVGAFFSDLRERWSVFWEGLRLLGGAGLVPMLVFGLTFLVVIRIPAGVSALVRWLVGPVDTNDYLAFSPYQDALGLVLSMVVTAPMLAAAIDWLIGPRLEVAAVSAEPAAPRSAAPRTTP